MENETIGNLALDTAENSENIALPVSALVASIRAGIKPDATRRTRYGTVGFFTLNESTTLPAIYAALPESTRRKYSDLPRCIKVALTALADAAEAGISLDHASIVANVARTERDWTWTRLHETGAIRRTA